MIILWEEGDNRSRGRGGIYHYYRCVKKQNYRNIKCSVGYINADEIEKYVVDKLLEISTQEDIFRQIVEQVNLEAESDCSPYQDELSEINSRISAVESEIENFFDAIESSGQKIVSLMEKRIEKQQDDLTELEKRKGELEDLVSNSPPR